MSNNEEHDHPSPENVKPPPRETPLPAPPGARRDIESQRPGETGFGVSEIVRRWRREDMLKKGSLALRGSGLLLCLLSFIIMASNKHGDWRNFDRYEEYRYVLAIAIISTIYAGGQTFRQVHELSTGKEVLPRRHVEFLDFIGDQVCAYLLISAASSAVPLTDRMREGGDNVFTDSSAAAISMEFLAFIAFALVAIISGYKLSNQSYI